MLKVWGVFFFFKLLNFLQLGSYNFLFYCRFCIQQRVKYFDKPLQSSEPLYGPLFSFLFWDECETTPQNENISYNRMTLDLDLHDLRCKPMANLTLPRRTTLHSPFHSLTRLFQPHSRPLLAPPCLPRRTRWHWNSSPKWSYK